MLNPGSSSSPRAEPTLPPPYVPQAQARSLTHDVSAKSGLASAHFAHHAETLRTVPHRTRLLRRPYALNRRADRRGSSERAMRVGGSRDRVAAPRVDPRQSSRQRPMKGWKTKRARWRRAQRGVLAQKARSYSRPLQAPSRRPHRLRLPRAHGVAPRSCPPRRTRRHARSVSDEPTPDTHGLRRSSGLA